MTTWIVALVAAVAAIPGALRLRAILRTGSYRRDDESGRPAPRLWWFIGVLPLAALLVTHTVAESRQLVVGLLYAAACVPLLALVAIDVDVHRLPDVLTLPLATGSVVVAGISSLVTGDAGAFGRALVAGVALFAAGFAVLFASPGGSGIGFGDVKLLAGIGVLTGWLGWPAVLSAMLLAFIAAGVWAAALLIARKAHRHTAIAFGPFLIGGAIVAFLGG